MLVAIGIASSIIVAGTIALVSKVGKKEKPVTASPILQTPKQHISDAQKFRRIQQSLAYKDKRISTQQSQLAKGFEDLELANKMLDLGEKHLSVNNSILDEREKAFDNTQRETEQGFVNRDIEQRKKDLEQQAKDNKVLRNPEGILSCAIKQASMTIINV